MFDLDLRMFQINILVPFLEGMESKCACICSREVTMEFWRMAARLASESSVVTTDCNTGLRSEHKEACKATNIFSNSQCEETVLWPFTCLENSFTLLQPLTQSVTLTNVLMV